MRKRRHSVLTKYLASYVGVVLLACAVIGLVLFLASVNELQATSETMQREWLQSAAGDIAAQYALMRDVAAAIRTTSYYQPYVLARHALTGLDLLEHFKRFAGYSSLLSEYYLYYERDGNVYSASAMYRLDHFAKYILQTETKAVCARMMGDDAFFSLSGRPDTTFAALPIQFRNTGTTQYAYLIVALPHQAVRMRYEELFNISGGLSIRYGGLPILGNLPEGRVITATSPDGMFELSMSVGGIAALGRLYGYRRLIIAMIVLITLVFVSIASAFAYRSYRPIRRLAQSYGTDTPVEDELKHIERVLREITHENRMNGVKLHDMLKRTHLMNVALKRHVLQLVLSGEYAMQPGARLEELGINLRRPLLCAIQIDHTAAVDDETMTQYIEALSEEGVSLYVLPLPKQCGWAIVLAADGHEELEAMIDILPECLAAQGIHVSLRVGPPCTEARQLADSFMHAVTDRSCPERLSAMDGWYAQADLSMLRRAIEAGQCQQAMRHVQDIVRQIETRCPTSLIQRYMYVDLTHRILEMARPLKRPISELDIQAAVTAHDTRQFYAAMDTLLRHICVQAADGPPASEGAQAVVDYIRAHACDYDISLEAVAKACCVSTKQVNHLLKSALDATYREYVIRLRMERAMSMLATGMSAAETAQRVGYADVSHFIKLFRMATGFTPGQYKTRA